MMKQLMLAGVVGLALTGVAGGQVLYNVNGYVFLEDSIGTGSHAGVKVKFYNLPSMAPEDSINSQTSGFYSINISPGYYLVEWTKDGYVPWELGGLSVAASTTLDTVTLLPGQVQEVSGNVSGTWTTGYVYHVVDNITIPGGETLTINPGVRVKFAAGKGLTCYGSLRALGTADAHVLFTSKEPTPLPGDWTNITLNSGNNVLTYLDYEWAADGIVGNGATGTSIDHLTINGTLSLTANGLYFTNSTDLTLTHNYLAVSGQNAIYADSAANSNISGNTIITPSFGIQASGCTQCSIDSNSVTTGDNTTGPDWAIQAQNSAQISVNHNRIVADEYGIYVPNSYQARITRNRISGRIYWAGIQFTNSDSSLVYRNHVQRTASNGEDWSLQYLIHGEGSEGSTIRRDTLICVGLPDWYQYNMAIRCEWSRVDSNYISFRFSYAENYCIYDNRNSDILNNTIETSSNGYNTQIIIESLSDGTYVNRIEKNTITHDYLGGERFHYAIWTQNNTVVRNNTISCDYLERAIYVQSNCVVDSNTISGDFSSAGLIYVAGSDVTINDNSITQHGGGTGIHAQAGSDLTVRNNHFTHTGGAPWLSADNSSLSAHHNLVELNSGRGVAIYNQSSGAVYNNTILSNNGDYGVHLSNQTALPVYNNILQGFQNGIFAENTIQNYNLDHNNLYAISSQLLSGSAIPPLAGQIIDQNSNGDPCDIYGNISLAPVFVDPGSDDYHLQAVSPCINAGRPNLLDPDGTASDMGAFFHFIYIVINHTPLVSTIDTTGPYPVNATVISTIDTTLAVWLHYSTDGGNTYTPVSMTPGTGNAWSSQIPGQSLNTTIHYYIRASDGAHTMTAPPNINNAVYSFYVTLFNQFANLGGSSDTYGNINLSWSTPVPLSGTLTGLRLYRSTTPGMALIPANLYAAFDSDVNTYTDTNVEEGDTYYYRMTGLVAMGTDTIESVVSSEIGIMSNNATIVRVRGVAYLENQSDHSGTKVYFEKTSPSAVSDSVYTDSSGYYDIVVVTGIYNVHFTRDGYQPQLLGHRFFADNAWLDTLTLPVGGVVELTGNVSGTFTANNLYFVDGNITIPAGDTLTIAAGTQVLFRGNYSLTAHGRLFVNGTPDNMVIFSSRLPVPAVGDWTGIILNSGAGGSVIKYALYKYAADGFIGNNLNQLTIWGCEVNTLAISARAITLNNCENVDIRYNRLNVRGDWVICKPQDEWDNSGTFIGNDIQAANSGMLIRRYHHLTVDSNVVSCTSVGIQTDYSRDMFLRHNTVTGQDYAHGVRAYDCDGARIIGNVVRGAGSWAYLLDQSQNLYFNNNTYVYSGNYYGAKGIYSGNCSGSLFIDNTVIYSDSLGQSYNCYGFYDGTNSIYRNNRLEIWKNSHTENGGFVYVNNSLFENNYVYLQAHHGDDYQRTAFSGSGNTSLNDTLILGSGTKGYHGANWTIRGAVINAVNSNNGDAAIDCRGGVLKVDDVTILNSERGIYGAGVGGHVRHTQVDVYGSSYGMKFENSATMTLYQNTVAGNGQGTGLWTTTNATLTTNSNIVYGFTTGLAAESPNTIQTSLFYNNGTNFTGAELPPQVGDVVTVNGNADPSDIYGNIMLNPQFVNAGNDDYHLLPSSPAINAGDIDSLDLDGTVADIGRYFYNYGYAPTDFAVDSTGNAFVAVSWSIIPTDSIQHFIPYYKPATASDWTPAGTTPDTSYVFTGLTNNVSYHFAVAVQYPNHVSDRSASVTARAGLAQIELWPPYIVSRRAENTAGFESFRIRNTGNKDLVWNAAAGYGYLSSPGGTLAPGASTLVTDSLPAAARGVSTPLIRVFSNAQDTPVDTVRMLCIVGNYDPVPPVHFSPATSGNGPFVVGISAAGLDGSSLQSGDEIAVYDGSTCVGAGIVTGQYPYILNCYGYSAGDTFAVRVYDYSQVREVEARFQLGSGSPAFLDSAFAYGSITGSIYRDQSLAMQSNMFNLVSLNLFPRYPNLSSVYSGLDSLEIVYNDQGQAYIPRYGINTIGTHVVVDGYHVFTRDRNPAVTVSGLPIDPGNYPILIEARRFNSIAYLNETAMPVETALAALADRIAIVQDDAGGVYIPELSVNTLGNMQPGKGYQVFSTEDTNLTLIYPQPSLLLAKTALPEPAAFPGAEVYTPVSPTGLPYAVVVEGLTIDGRRLPLRGEIALYDGDLCVGAGSFESFPVVIIGWGGSEEYDLDGFRTGSRINYRVYLADYAREFAVTDHNGTVFGQGPYARASLSAKPGIIPADFYLSQNYPNPFNPVTAIGYGLAEESPVRVTIYDLLGREVWSRDCGTQLPGHYVIEWHGTDMVRRPLASGMYFYRLQAGARTAVKKLVLIR